jgi:hypothetical protein
MTASELSDVAADGRVAAALERGEWPAALALLRGVQQQRPLTPAVTSVRPVSGADR